MNRGTSRWQKNRVIILTNVNRKISTSQLQTLVGGFSFEVLKYETSYEVLVLPVISSHLLAKYPGPHDHWRLTMPCVRVISIFSLLLSSTLFVSCGGSKMQPAPLNPVPTLASLSPQSASQFGLGVTLGVTGTSFMAGSTAQVNGVSRSAQFVSGTALNVQLPASDLAALGTLQLTVTNPAPGGGVSNALSFDVLQPPIGVFRIVTVATDGTQANDDNVSATFSANGRFVAFDSLASNLVPNDTNGNYDVFVRDTCLGVTTACTPTTTQVSVAPDGSGGNSLSRYPSISADGRFVAFYSLSDNLVPNDTNFAGDVFLRDTCAGAPAGCVPSTILISLADDGSQANYDTGSALISGDGRYVAFTTLANNLVPDDTDGFADVFVRDTCINGPLNCLPSTTRVSLATDGSQVNSSGSAGAAITPDGRFVLFQSDASNLVPNDTNNTSDIFERDTCVSAPAGCTPTTTRVSVANDGSEGNDGSFVSAISPDGRFISFTSLATNLVANDTNGKYDVFLRDTCFGATGGCSPSTIRVSVASDGAESDGDSLESSVSSGGRYVLFASVATNLVSNDTNGSDDEFVRDTCIGAPAGCVPSTYRVSVAADGTQGNAHSYEGLISPDGRFVLLRSIATDLLSGDTNNFSDFFLAFN